MKRVVLSVLVIAFAASVSAQEKKKEYPKPEAMRPAMTEFWTPQPKVGLPVISRQTRLLLMPLSCLMALT